jgi:hypothetical protein
MNWHHPPVDVYWLVDREPVQCTLLEWAAWYEELTNRQLADDYVDGVRVSTVFIGCVDTWFESLVMGGVHDGECRRHRTWNAAMAAHDELLELVRGGNPPV